MAGLLCQPVAILLIPVSASDRYLSDEVDNFIGVSYCSYIDSDSVVKGIGIGDSESLPDMALRSNESSAVVGGDLHQSPTSTNTSASPRSSSAARAFVGPANGMPVSDRVERPARPPAPTPQLGTKPARVRQQLEFSARPLAL